MNNKIATLIKIEKLILIKLMNMFKNRKLEFDKLKDISYDMFISEEIRDLYISLNDFLISNSSYDIDKFKISLTEEQLEQYKYLSKMKDTRKSLSKLLDLHKEYRKFYDLMKFAKELTKDINNKKTAVDDILMKALTEINRISMATYKSNNIDILDVAKDARKYLKRILRADNPVEVIPTGIAAFDKRNKGLLRGSLIVLAATSGGGKSTLALQISLNAYLSGKKVCFVSLEMDNEKMFTKLLSNLSGVYLSKLNMFREQIDDKEKKLLVEKSKILERGLVYTKHKRESDFLILNPKRNIDSLSLLTYLNNLGKVYDLYVLDYITLLDGFDGDRQWQKIGTAIRQFKLFAESRNCVFMALAQLDDEKMKAKYSAAIKEHADNMWIWSYGEKEKQAGNKFIEIHQPKARNQVPFTFILKDRLEVSRFENVDAGGDNDLDNYADASAVDSSDYKIDTNIDFTNDEEDYTL